MSKKHDEVFKLYQAEPNSENLYNTVRSLDNTINYTLSSLNSYDNPVMRSKALVYTANAVRKYDPDAGAALPTFVTSELRRLIRDQRAINAPVKIPDRAMLDAHKIDQSEKKYEEEFGREPDLLELADFSGIATERIEKVRKQMPAMPTEDAFGESGLGDQTPDYETEAMRMVYHDSDHVDRKIMEYKMGFGGKSQIPANAVSLKLKISPSQVTRRSQRISKRIINILDDQHAINS
jgi:DNA-directed RNA polymerase specialized sigma subunit